jgi:hypothetical protein
VFELRAGLGARSELHERPDRFADRHQPATLPVQLLADRRRDVVHRTLEAGLSEIKMSDEIEFPTFVESSESVQEMTHAACFDRFRVDQESGGN